MVSANETFNTFYGGGKPAILRLTHIYGDARNYIYSPTPYPKIKIKKEKKKELLSRKPSIKCTPSNYPRRNSPPFVERLLSLDSNVPPNAILGAGLGFMTKPFKPLPTDTTPIGV